MKNLVIALIATFAFSTSTLIAQENKAPKGVQTSVIKVSGNCGECKERIENAAYTKGVKRAEWNKQTKELTVTYSTKKTSLDKIEHKIADAGHDAGEIKATDAAYNKLPACCAYKDVAEH